jgi:hypothetical protein
MVEASKSSTRPTRDLTNLEIAVLSIVQKKTQSKVYLVLIYTFHISSVVPPGVRLVSLPKETVK